MLDLKPIRAIQARLWREADPSRRADLSAAMSDHAGALLDCVDDLRELLAEVATLGDIVHDPDGDCSGADDDCGPACDEPGCNVAHYNEVMHRVRQAVSPGEAEGGTP